MLTRFETAMAKGYQSAFRLFVRSVAEGPSEEVALDAEPEADEAKGLEEQKAEDDDRKDEALL